MARVSGSCTVFARVELYLASDPESGSESESESEPTGSPESDSESESEQRYHDSATLVRNN